MKANLVLSSEKNEEINKTVDLYKDFITNKIVGTSFTTLSHESHSKLDILLAEDLLVDSMNIIGNNNINSHDGNSDENSKIIKYPPSQLNSSSVIILNNIYLKGIYIYLSLVIQIISLITK